MNLLITLRSEILKSKRTASFYLTIIAAALIPFIFVLDVMFDGISAEHKKDPFNAIFREGFINTGFVIFPLFVILISTLLPQIEFRNNAWKQVLASPQTKLNVFMSKYLNIHLLIVVFLVAHNIFMFVAAIAMHFIDPTLNLLNQPLDVYTVVANNLNTYVTLLAVGVIQFWVGLRFRNFILPIGIGFALWFMGTLMALELHWSMADYFPHSFHIYSIFENRKPQLPTIQLRSVMYAAVFLVLGFIDFRTRSRKS